MTLHDDRQFVGKFLAYDKHMNLVLSDCSEYRRIPSKQKGQEDRETRRALDLVLIRGENVVSLSVEGPPPADDTRIKLPAAAGGLGRGAPAGRGVSAALPGAKSAPPGLSGTAFGAGGPPPGMMMPPGAAVSGAPMAFAGRGAPMGRGMMPPGET